MHQSSTWRPEGENTEEIQPTWRWELSLRRIPLVRIHHYDTLTLVLLVCAWKKQPLGVSVGFLPLWILGRFWQESERGSTVYLMASLGVSSLSFSNSEDESPGRTPVPDSSRYTSHTGNQSGFSGLGYGVCVAWLHLRPFIPFFLISFMVVALVYLMQAIIYGGPFKDPLFFVKFNERWPRPSLNRQDSLSPTTVSSPVSPSSIEQVLNNDLNNETAWIQWEDEGWPGLNRSVNVSYCGSIVLLCVFVCGKHGRQRHSMLYKDKTWNSSMS